MSNEERQAALKLWMEENSLDFQRLAEVVGTSRVFVSVMLRRETIPARRHRQFVALGVPADLLPKPVDPQRVGRPRNFLAEVAATATA